MVWVYFLSYVFVIGMAMNYHEELEKTGIIDVQAVIEASANSAPVYPEEGAEETTPEKEEVVEKVETKSKKKKKK